LKTLKKELSSLQQEASRTARPPLVIARSSLVPASTTPVVVRLLLLPALLVLSTSLRLAVLVMLFACASSSPTWAC
jgi:hypothetical protein